MIKSFRKRLDFIGPFDVIISAVLLGLFVGAVYGSRAAHAASAGVDWFAWTDGFLQNFGTEMLGAFLTFFLLELLRGSREKQAEEARWDEERRQQEEAEERRAGELKALQQTVADELQKQIRGFVQAQEIARLRAAQTPEDRQAILDGMKATGLLKGANLEDAYLKEASLMDANFKGAVLMGANLEGADLLGANFEEASLVKANLKRAVLVGANLVGADLWYADLTGAILMDANLEGANFENAILPNGEKLPDRNHWRTPFEAWDRAGRPRVEPKDDESEGEQHS